VYLQLCIRFVQGINCVSNGGTSFFPPARCIYALLCHVRPRSDPAMFQLTAAVVCCVVARTGLSRLRVEPSTLCWQGSHMPAGVFSCVALFAFTFGA
jgi:hypothetical protein